MEFIFQLLAQLFVSSDEEKNQVEARQVMVEENEKVMSKEEVVEMEGEPNLFRMMEFH